MATPSNPYGDSRYQVFTTTILSGASLSSEINLAGLCVVAIIMPASWTAANLTFQAASVSAGTFNDVYDEAGTELTVTATASDHIIFPSDKALGLGPVIKVRSGTSAAAVNQGADRSIGLVLRAL